MFEDLAELPEADDALVDKMLHTADEIAFKDRIWKAQNREFLKKEREAKRKRKEAKKLDKHLQGSSLMQSGGSPTSSQNPLSL